MKIETSDLRKIIMRGVKAAYRVEAACGVEAGLGAEPLPVFETFEDWIVAQSRSGSGLANTLREKCIDAIDGFDLARYDVITAGDLRCIIAASEAMEGVAEVMHYADEFCEDMA